MTKDEIIKAMDPFAGNTKVSVTDAYGMQIDIKHLDYRPNNGTTELTIVPMGSHLPENEFWAIIMHK